MVGDLCWQKNDNQFDIIFLTHFTEYMLYEFQSYFIMN